MSKKTFLVEIGTEELPPKSLRNLAESFAINCSSELNKVGLTYSKVQWFATPRRLAVKVENLATSQLNQEIKKRGPTIVQAFDANGKPNKVAERWAKDCGIDISQAKRLITDKGEWLLYHKTVQGKNAEILLPNVVTSSLLKLPIRTHMRWGEGNFRFVRPIHTVTLLLGDKVTPINIFGIKSDRIIYGHRFMGMSKISIKNANQYPSILEKSRVLADYNHRKAKIKANVEEAAHKVRGNADLTDSLLEEITSLVEWPVVLSAKFEKKFLMLPTEAIIYLMQKNQKYIPVYTKNKKLLPHFIFVINLESKDPQKIIAGNEKVIHSRLKDAEFFFMQDRKKRLEDYLPSLKKQLFQEKLGSLFDKTIRVQALAIWISNLIGANINHTNRASLLSKCDLMTNMVSEFSEVQGVIGMYYARYDGEEENVSVALKEQYQPRFSGDLLPSNLVSCSIAIADKIDTIVGIFGISQHPKGDKDPFGLRRSAIGILRIIIEKKIDLDLKVLIEKAVYLYNKKLTNVHVVTDVINFMIDRVLIWYQNKGYKIDTIRSVLSCRQNRLVDFDAHIKAVSKFRKLEAAESLTIANKRIANILAKSKDVLNASVNSSMLTEESEIKLSEKLEALDTKIKSYLIKGRYYDILVETSSLCNLIDEFFKKIMINSENKDIRINRLTLLAKFQKMFLQVVDISFFQ